MPSLKNVPPAPGKTPTNKSVDLNHGGSKKPFTPSSKAPGKPKGPGKDKC